MDLRKLIDENVECVDTPNGKYLNREQVFKSIKLAEENFTSDNKPSFQFPKLEEVVKSVLHKFQRGYLPNHDENLINHVYDIMVGNKKH